MEDVKVGTESVVGWRLGIADGAVDILYNTFVVNGDQERVCVGASVIRKLTKKFLYPC